MGYREGTILDEVCRLDKAGRDPIRLVWQSVDGENRDVSFSSSFEAASSALTSTLSFNVSSLHHGGAFKCFLDAPDDGFDDLECEFGPITVEYDVRATADNGAGIDEDVEGEKVTITLIGNPAPVPERVSVAIDPALSDKAASSQVASAMSGAAVSVSIKVKSDAVGKTPLKAASVNISYDDVVVKRLTFYPSSVATGGGGGGGGSAGAIAGVIVALVLIAIFRFASVHRCCVVARCGCCRRCNGGRASHVGYVRHFVIIRLLPQ